MDMNIVLTTFAGWDWRAIGMMALFVFIIIPFGLFLWTAFIVFCTSLIKGDL